jgi:REP element-mobilizing transposase RayT
MPRHARLDATGALHHIMLRGINKGDLFVDDVDRKKFLDRLGQVAEGGRCTVYAFAVMSSHVHRLIRSGDMGISAIMRKLLTWYALYFNRRHRRTGHLFENRYKSILCEEEPYFLELVRYIHLDPVRAGMVTDMAGLDSYPWTGHRVIVGKATSPWIDRDFTLLLFGKTRRKAQAAYRSFISAGFSMGHLPHLVGGGLVRSLGGWSKVASLRQHGAPEKGDERILGSSAFVMTVLRETEETQRRQVKAGSADTMLHLIDEECRKRQIDTREVQSGGRRTKASEARAAIAYRATTEFGLPAAEIARNLGVTTASITRAVQKVDKRSHE